MNKSPLRKSLAVCIPTLLALFVLCAAIPARAQEDRKLSMREAVALALQNSRDLALARVQYTVALNEAGVDRSAFRPNLYTGSGAAYTYGFPTIGGGPPAVFQLNYNQAIFDPVLKAQQQAAEDHAKNMKLEIDRTRDDVIVRTAVAYLELAEVRHSLELLRKEQVSAEKILGVTRERVAGQSGTRDRSDSQRIDRGARPGAHHQARKPRRNSYAAASQRDRRRRHPIN